MIEWYLPLRWTHIICIVLSGSLFLFRGLLMLRHSAWTNHTVLKRLSYVIDMTLLAAALLLTGIVHQYPFVNAWLTAKVMLLLIYIVLGSLALKRGRTQALRAASFAAALLVYLTIISIARTHSPSGWLNYLHGAG